MRVNKSDLTCFAAKSYPPHIHGKQVVPAKAGNVVSTINARATIKYFLFISAFLTRLYIT
jgi:hypothetical protein